MKIPQETDLKTNQRKSLVCYRDAIDEPKPRKNIFRVAHLAVLIIYRQVC